jgi:hypothetical protein
VKPYLSEAAEYFWIMWMLKRSEMCEKGWKTPRNIQKNISLEIHDIYFLITLNQPPKGEYNIQ